MSRKVVLLGMMSKMPVSGVVWQTLHYLVGFQRLGFEPYYVEAHGRTPSSFIAETDPSGTTGAAAFIADVMHRFDLDGRWAFHALHDDGSCYGMSGRDLRELYGSACLIVNLHGGTQPRPEYACTDRLVYLETDPVTTQVRLHRNRRATHDFLAPHAALFTFAENYGHRDCAMPVTEGYEFRPTRQPVVLDFWRRGAGDQKAVYTTVGNWRQPWRSFRYRGQTYTWSKHLEFAKFLDLPCRTAAAFELALASYEEDDRATLQRHGWRVCDAAGISDDLCAYRDYITRSRGEFTVAKDQNVRMRSGWFSDRSATYLAAGRPVVTQETGFSNILPSGEGLFGFSTLEEAISALDAIESDYGRHCRRAREIAREYFSHEVVLGSLLSRMGVAP